ncbi:MAG: hypothetical protein JNN17_18075 [Verrucomicrobiaceae bacterium]|nr:hypothetical protein [Verrucomicrobiaceae bacterium]
MNSTSLTIHLLAISVLLVCSSCTTTVWQHAQRSDGLIDFVLGGARRELPVTVEKVSDEGGTIVSAHVRSSVTGTMVFGLVGRHSLFNPPAGSHVDVVVLNARGEAIEGTAVDYLPRELPSGRRIGFSYSRYSVSLASKPPSGSSVKIVFHGAPKSACDFARRP